MTTNIQLLRSSIAQKRPDPTMLLEGQAAVNISPASGSAGLYFALTDDTLVKVGPVAFSPISPPNTIPAGHPGHSIGEEWIDTSPNYFQPVQKVYNGSRWVNSSGFLTDDNTGDFTLNKTMHLRTMEAHGKAQYSYIRVPQDNYDARRIIPGAAGMFRFNNDEQTLKFEGHDGSEWVQFATSSGTTTLENLELTGDLQSSGNVDLCSDCNNDFRVRGEGLFDCGVSVQGGINVKGNGFIQGEQVIFNTNLSDKTYVNGGLVTSGDSEFERSLVVGRLGNTSLLTVNCPSYLLNDTRIGVDNTHKLTVSATAEFEEYANLRNDVRIGDTISNNLLVNSTARFRGHVELGDPIGSTNLDVYSTTTFLKDVAFQENVTIGSDKSDLLTIKAAANLQNDVTIGQQNSDTLEVLAKLVQVSDADFKENVIIGSDPFDELTVNATSVFNASVQLGSEAAQVVHVKATPQFHTNIIPSTNLGSSLGETDTRFGEMHIHDGSVTGKLTVHELEVQHETSFQTDFAIGFDELHDFEVKATTLFTAPVGFERDVFIGDGSTDLLTVDATSDFNAPVALFSTLFVEDTVIVNDDILPNIDDKYTLGSSLLRWKNIYGVKGDFSGTVSIETLDPVGNLRVVHNTHLGTDDLDDLIVDATLRQHSAAFFDDNVTIGEDAFDELFVNSSANFYAPVALSNTLFVEDTVTVNDDVLPNIDDTYTLGSLPLRWKTVYGVSGDFSGTVSIETLDPVRELRVVHNTHLGTDDLDDLIVNATLRQHSAAFFNDNVTVGDAASDELFVNSSANFYAPVALSNTLFVEDTVTVNDNVLPNIDDTYTLGSSLLRWKDIYGVNGDFSGTVSIETLAPIGHTLQAEGLRVVHNSHLGTDDSDDLIVDATLRQHSAAFFDDDVTIGEDAFDELFVNSSASFYANTVIGLSGSIGSTNLDVYSIPYFYTNIFPDADASVDVGSASQRWKDVYALNAYLTNNLEVGSNCGDNLLVHATSLFKCDSTTEGNVVLNSSAGLTTTINGTLNATSEVNLNTNSSQNTNIIGNLDSKSNVILNTDCSNTTTIKGDLTAECDVTINGNLDLLGNSDLKGDVNLNSSCSDTTLVKGVLDTRCDVDLCATNTQTMTVRGDQFSLVNVTLNSNCGQTTTIKGVQKSLCDVELNSTCDNTTTIKGVQKSLCDVELNSTCDNTTTIKGVQKSLCDVELNSSCSDLTTVKGRFHTDCDVILNNASGDTINKGNLTVNKNATVDVDLTVQQKSYLEDRVTCGGNVIPKNNNSVDLGTTSNRWRNIYTNDMHFSNIGGKANDVDGTNGTWTLQEGKDNLFLINNLTGAKFRISMEPVG